MNNLINEKYNTFFINPYPWCNELNFPIKVPGYENINKYNNFINYKFVNNTPITINLSNKNNNK